MDDLTHVRWETPVVLPVAGLTLGAAVGLVTNAVNARVSTGYFVAVLGIAPGDAANLIFLHGVVEGGILGLAFGLIFALAASASSRLRVPLQTALVSLALAIAVTVACSIAGGAVGATWAAASPSSFHAACPLATGFAGGDLSRFGWVGGTIDGAYVGTAVAALVGCVHLHVRWRSIRRLAGRARAFTVLQRLQAMPDALGADRYANGPAPSQGSRGKT